MIDPRLFGYAGLFADRDTIKEAVEQFTVMIQTIQNSSDKAAMLTSALVLSNTLAKVSATLATFIEQNSMANLKLVDGTEVGSLRISQLRERYDFPFEAPLLNDLLEKLILAGEDPLMSEVIPRMPSEGKVFILMAQPRATSGS